MARKYSAAALLCLLAAPSKLDVASGLVVGSRPFLSGRALARRRTRSRPSPLRMYIDDPTAMTAFDIPSFPSYDEMTAPMSMATAGAAPHRAHALDALDDLASDPKVETQLLNDASHVALDMSTFFGRNTAWLRLFSVVGRICVISSDFIQGIDNFSMDEKIFQASMLVVSTRLFFQSAWPVILAMSSVSALTVRERRTYALLFEAVGLSVLQFKTLLASSTLEWVDYEAQDKIELDGAYMYFLYKGEAGSASVASNETSHGQGIIDRVFGDVQFAKALESSAKTKTKSKSKSGKKEATASSSAKTVAIGPSGASMLRMSTSKVLELMENDNELSSSVQRLVLLCMQERLSRTQEIAPAEHRNSSAGETNATYDIPLTLL
ncbi:hypothetical protein ACHAXT_006131 [Thalassiosira profunda]